MKLEITFYSYWHCGAGTSGGSRIDAIVAKDKHNLPYIPGKTLKGHLREMAESFADCKVITKCFGMSSNEKDPCYDKNEKKKHGVCHFSDAVLEESVSKELSSYLYKTISSTAIGEKGIAKSNSLRSIEVVVPLTLYATVDTDECDEDELAVLTKACRHVKRIGLNRSRGLGRCEITVQEERA